MDAANGKAKKPIFKRVWFWIVVVIVIIAVASQMGTAKSTPDGQNSSTPGTEQQNNPKDETTPDTSIEDRKAAAKSFDAEIANICTLAESDYQKFAAMIAAGTASDLDAYNTAKTLKSNLEYYNYDKLSKIKDDEAKEYKSSVSSYIFAMTKVAEKAMKYIDEPSTSKLSEVQEAIKLVSPYMIKVAANRLTYLTDSGFTSDEIASITGTGTPATE